MKWAAICIPLCLALAGCSESSSEHNNNFVELEDTFVAPKVVQKPAHRYDFKEGLTYGYISAVSEEERKKGKAAGDVLMYKYYGAEGGIHRLRSVDATGRETGSYECSTPCVAIKAFYGQAVERIAYNPGSVVGSAFQDAINGHLEPVRSPKPAPIIESEWAGKYVGAFEGNATGYVTITDWPNGVSVVIGIAHERCTGGLEFSAPQPASASLVKRFPVDDSGHQCTLTLTRTGPRLAIAEDGCFYYHGAECSFNGAASR